MTIYIEKNKFANEVEDQLKAVVNGDTALNISSTPVAVNRGVVGSIDYFQVTYKPVSTGGDLGKELINKLANNTAKHIFISGVESSYTVMFAGHTPAASERYVIHKEGGGYTTNRLDPPHVDLYVDGTENSKNYTLVIEERGFNTTEEKQQPYMRLYHELLHAEGLIDGTRHSHGVIIPRVNDFRVQRGLKYKREEPYCFIVSAATGSFTSKAVETLLQLRNRLLRPNSIGSLIEHHIYSAYIRFSPQVADEIERSSDLRRIVLAVLVNPFIDFLILARDYAFDIRSSRQLGGKIEQIRRRYYEQYTRSEISSISDRIASWSAELHSPGKSTAAIQKPLAWEGADLEDVLNYLSASINAEVPNDPYIIWALSRPLAAMWEIIADPNPNPETLFIDRVYSWLADLPLPSEINQLPAKTIAEGIDQLNQTLFKYGPVQVAFRQRIFADRE